MRSPLQARIVEWCVAPGDTVSAGQTLLIVEAMKMEHELRADRAGVVGQRLREVGEMVEADDALLDWDTAGPAPPAPAFPSSPDSFHTTTAPDSEPLRRLHARLAFTLDAARPDAVARRHARGLRTARENVADLCDPGSFNEYGALAIAAQRQRRPVDELIAQTPADGIVTGVGSVNGAVFGPERSRTAVLAYDATVLAGTQGMRSHQKTDRLLQLAHADRLPVVLFAEGGGGRPGDTDMPIVAGLHVGTFAAMARLAGRVPLIGVAAGRCFAGNAALLGCCDLIVATRDSSIGMGGPAMIEGAGLGVVAPEAVGPATVHAANGVIDALVADEAEAVAVVRQLLALWQGDLPATDAAAPDPLALRAVVPPQRARAYDARAAVTGLLDLGSVVWLRDGFGRAVHTALGRLGGRSVGVLASNPQHLAGAIDPDAADKAARFLRLCDVRGLPVITLVDTPGFMVGPAVEAQAQVRHASRLFLAAAQLQVPVFSVVMRKGYGLGAMGLTAGGFHAPRLTLAWPQAEFGAMGLEGAVRLGYRKELAAAGDDAAREALFQRLLQQQIDAGSAVEMATTLEIDAVIDPAETRDWLLRALQAAPRSAGAARPGVLDAW